MSYLNLREKIIKCLKICIKNQQQKIEKLIFFLSFEKKHSYIKKYLLKYRFISIIIIILKG